MSFLLYLEVYIKNFSYDILFQSNLLYRIKKDRWLAGLKCVFFGVFLR